MARSRKLLMAVVGVMLSMILFSTTGMVAEADSSSDYLDALNRGVVVIIDPSVYDSSEHINEMAAELNISLEYQVLDTVVETDLVMANVRSALNVRQEPNSDAKKVGKLYKDCGGRMLEYVDGWVKIKSGNVEGWVSEEYLFFGEEAKAKAAEVGTTVAKVTADVLNVRKEPSLEAGILVQLPMDYEIEVKSVGEDGWLLVEYDKSEGYIRAEFVEIDFEVEAGETTEEIKARQKKEEENKRYKWYDPVEVDEDTLMLLAALIHCEAGGEPYEGQVAVGAVVMNRVRSSKYPNTIRDVIYAPGQFTPAMSGKVDRILAAGKTYASCIRAAEDVLAGYSNVGDMVSFRRNSGKRKGLVIGNHVFY